MSLANQEKMMTKHQKQMKTTRQTSFFNSERVEELQLQPPALNPLICQQIALGALKFRFFQVVRQPHY
jgi:hypothetical protein